MESYRTAIEDLRDPLESRNPAGLKLSEILLGPIREIAKPGGRVVIIPDGALHSLNFGTLPSPEDAAKYWIEDVTLSVAPSLGLVLNSRAANQPERANVLAIGDPESPGQEFPPLPNARKEVDTIAALFSNSDRVVYEGAASQPSVYRGSNPARFEFIHFAAHATANPASPLDSALILSREGNTYTLTARQIMQVPLHARVVTLSSCRSAGARAYSGEGLVGLTWAFLQAGARNVVGGTLGCGRRIHGAFDVETVWRLNARRTASRCVANRAAQPAALRLSLQEAVLLGAFPTLLRRGKTLSRRRSVMPSSEIKKRWSASHEDQSPRS